MYFPVLKIQNAKHVVKEHLLAADRPTTDYYWIHGPHSIEYQQSLQTKIYCSFKFTLFPFDSNQCNFVIRSGESRDSFLKLLPFEIHYNEIILVHGQEPIQIEQSVLPLGKGVSCSKFLSAQIMYQNSNITIKILIQFLEFKLSFSVDISPFLCNDLQF